MRYHVIINALYDGYEKQIRELNGFIKNSNMQFTQGNTIIICDGKQDGDGKQQLAEMAPTKSVIFVYIKKYDPEILLDYFEKSIDLEDLYLFGSTYSAEELSIRLGKRMDGSSVMGCMNIRQSENGIEAEKMVYSNHMRGQFLLQKAPYCIAIAKGQAEAVNDGKERCIAEETDLRNETGKQNIFIEKFEQDEAGSGLENADFVIAAGRGIRKRETAAEMEMIAGQIGAAFGASRPVVMNAWAPMQKLIGVSGAMLKPKICITFGVSGAPAFYAGIEKSEFIVAVNTDEKAAIVKKADAVVIGDCMEVLQELEKQIKAERFGMED